LQSLQFNKIGIIKVFPQIGSPNRLEDGDELGEIYNVKSVDEGTVDRSRLRMQFFAIEVCNFNVSV